MRLGFYFDQSRCSGCDTCVVACKDWHDVAAGPASWIKIETIEKGRFPDLSVSFLFTTCFHCADAPCIRACPVDAISNKKVDRIVMVDREVCVGGEECRFACLKACPYNAPQFGSEPNARMQKCDLCLDRWAEGKKPICVGSCLMRALDAGPLDELKDRYGDVQDAEGFVYSKKAKPSVVLKPRARLNTPK